MFTTELSYKETMFNQVLKMISYLDVKSSLETAGKEAPKRCYNGCK